MTVAQALRAAADTLAAAGVPEPEVDAEWLLAHALACSRAELTVLRARPLSGEQGRTVQALVARRAVREPLAYVLGEWGFRRLTLRTDPRALVPRPETEVVVERCLALLEDASSPRILDVGVGSGAIALALVDEHAGAHVLGVDASEDALSLARENAERTGLSDRVDFERVDVRVRMPPGPFELIVSNPPYVEADELPGLDPEVRDWEPRSALVGEDMTATVVAAAWDALEPGGFLVLETHALAARAVVELVRTRGYDGSRITRDLAGRERVVEGRRP